MAGAPGNDLVGATFGRSFYVLDDYTPLREVSDNMLKNGSVLFPVRKADWYVPRSPMGCDGTPGCKASQGDSYWTAPNPLFGATFTYYLAEEIQSSKDARREVEKEKEKNNEDVVAIGWDTVIAESREDAPAIVFTIKNSNGMIVDQVVAPATAGFNRVAWDLRYPSVEPWAPVAEGEEAHEGTGVLVVPGRYSVTMHKRINGSMTDFGQVREFDVVSIRPDPVIDGVTQEQRVVFESQVDELIRAASGTSEAVTAMIGELDAVKATLRRSMTDGSLYEVAHSLQQQLRDAQEVLTDNELRDFYNDLPIMSVQARLWHARFDPSSSAQGPNSAQQESYRIARKLYDDTVADLTRLVETEYAGLKEAMDTARIPWTPGRGIQ
jgi:hypothetical protein